MLRLYRRHNPACPKVSDRYWKRCTFPMGAEGTADGTYIRRSLKTKSWGKAVANAREIEASEDPTPAPPKQESISVEEAVKEYLEGARAR